MLRAGLLLLVVAVPTVARADILMWRDTSGVRHYTNLKKLVPAEADASIVLEDIVVPASAEAAPAPAPSAPDLQSPPRLAEVVYDQNALAEAYAEGWRRGMATVQQNQATGGVSVQINGPLSIDESAPYVNPAWWYAPSLVTTSFDGGRSRHLTLRMLMQDQFAVDREGPYLAIDRFPPLGPNLATVMPRGLPYFVKPGSRVINY